MICGCSWRISSATARGSIHLSASRPLLERPNRMRSITPRALSSPSAPTRTLRRYSSTPTPSEVCPSTDNLKSLNTCDTSLREMFCNWVIAAPMRCTSFAPMCRITSVASASPSDNRKIAARSVPLRLASAAFFLLIVANPRLHYLCHARCVLRHHRARLRNLSVVVERRARGLAARQAALCSTRQRGRRICDTRSREQAFDQRTQHHQHQHQQHDQSREQLGDVAHQRTLPQRDL